MIDSVSYSCRQTILPPKGIGIYSLLPLRHVEAGHPLHVLPDAIPTVEFAGFPAGATIPAFPAWPLVLI